MTMTLASLKSRLNDVNEIEIRASLNKAVAFIFCDGHASYNFMRDVNGHGCYFVYGGGEFRTNAVPGFKTDLSGILASIDETAVSWIGGEIDGHRVVFVHPTSNTVNYQKVLDALKELKDIPVIEYEASSFASTLRHKVPEFSELVTE